MDGQIEVINHNLGNLLGCLVKENLRNWDLILPTAQIAYNSFVNQSLGMSPFEVVRGYKPMKPLDLILMTPHASVSMSTEAFAQHLHELHIEINKQLEASNASYKLRADLHRRHVEFNIGDYVMIQI